VRTIRNKKVEKGRWQDRPLRNTSAKDHDGRLFRAIDTPSRPTSEVGCQPPDEVGVQVRAGDLVNQEGMIDTIKGFADINSTHGQAPSRLGVIEANRHLCGNRQ
jgi:hypothetical protein